MRENASSRVYLCRQEHSSDKIYFVFTQAALLHMTAVTAKRLVLPSFMTFFELMVSLGVRKYSR
jgi:hypothetical protein